MQKRWKIKQTMEGLRKSILPKIVPTKLGFNIFSRDMTDWDTISYTFRFHMSTFQPMTGYT